MVADQLTEHVGLQVREMGKELMRMFSSSLRPLVLARGIEARAINNILRARFALVNILWL